MEERPNYYAVIPANVRYDENLKLGAKMMYGEITSLTSKTGECWASNNYFAKLYGVSPQAISKWVKSLEKANYITIEYEKDGKLTTKRIIKLVSTTVDRGINYSLEGYQPQLIGYQQEIKENNINTNNTSINNNKKEIYKEKEICERVITRLNELNNTKYSTKSEGNIKFIKGRLNEGYTEEDLLLVVEKMSYLWNQPNDKDMRQYLRPSTLFRPTNFDNYLNMPVKERKLTTKDLASKMDFTDFLEKGKIK